MSSNINVLAELERCGLTYEWAGEDEVRICCPFHDDAKPSCHVNLQKRVFKCHTAGCAAAGDIIKLIARALRQSRSAVQSELATRYAFDVGRVVDPDVIERFHAAIWDAQPLLKELYNRGVTDALIRQYRLGEHDGRVQIPIKDENGYVVNVRRYLPGAPGADKMKNMRGRGKPRLYPLEQLKYDSVMLCGGEIKAIAAAAHLNKHGIGAVTTTAGEGNWDVSFTPQFAGKDVYVCMDIDEEGQAAAQSHCARLHRVATQVYNVVLPLNVDDFPHGDINDYIAARHSLKRLINDATPWEPPIGKLLDLDEPEDTDLSHAVRASSAGKRMRMKGVVSAMDTAPYIVPKEVSIHCDKSLKECAVCPVPTLADGETVTIPPESIALLEMVATSIASQRDALIKAMRIPASCGVCRFEAHQFYNIEDARISPQLEISNRAADRVMQPALCIGDGLELNESYSFIGRTYPHPKTQQSTFLISSYETTQDALSTYVPDGLEKLDVFAADEWTCDSVAARVSEIYTDLEANVTRIFQRRDLHLMIDLAYHSPLLFEFDQRVVKGWVEVLVLGDSAQGKSETALNLMRHYGLGEKVECKNATVAGLLGGLQQMGNRWFVSWGVIPTHDKRLVVLEELKGASTEVIARLTDMRSSGVAEIPKIEKRRTHARTRLVALSNPRSDMPLSSYNFGIEAIKELVGGLEDIRRFDAALLVSSSDIDSARLNVLQRSRPRVEKRFTSELCRSLILWAWTRTQDEVDFEDEAQSTVLDEATALSSQFTDRIPLMDRGSGRLKIARLAAAMAARTFSTDSTRSRLVVRKCHVEFVVEYLRRIYSSSVMGYEDFTMAVEMTQKLIDPDAVRAQVHATPFARDLVQQLLHTERIDRQSLEDWCGWDRVEAQQLLSFFVRKHALLRDNRCYRKTAPFIALLKRMLDDDTFTDRPDFIQEDF